MFKLMSKFIGFKNTQKIFEFYYLFNNFFLLIFNYKKHKNVISSKNKILIGLIPSHGNIGDYALYYAAKKMAIDFYPNYEVIELNIVDTSKQIFRIRNQMNSDTDLVFLIGGGNMGSRYLTEEITRQIIFYYFRKFKRIQLPQSSSYKNFFILSITKKIFSINKKSLLITSRDEKSNEFFKQEFKNKVLLLPDSVLYLDYETIDSRSDKILYCLREDLESNLTIEQRKWLIDEMSKNIKNIESFNTIKTDNNVTNEVAYEKIIGNIKNAKLVITDRLHGVIFSYITNTPVVAIKTKDHKLSTFFKWLKDSDKCILIEDIEDLNDAIAKLTENPSINKNYLFKKEFKILIKEISEL